MEEVLLFDNFATKEILLGLTDDILREPLDFNNVSIIGIKEGGVPIAGFIRDEIKKKFGILCETGFIDMTLYRDDPFNVKKSVGSTELSFDVNGKIVILVDDVIMSGRTVRAAIDQIFDFGRPQSIKLAVFIDKGGRELPICPDFTGKKVRAAKKEIIYVNIEGKEKSVKKVIKK